MKNNINMPLLANSSFDISLFELFLPLLSGGQATLLENNDIKDIDNLKKQFKVNNAFHAVPALMNQITDNIISSNDKEIASHIEEVFVGGDKVPTETLRKIKQVFSNARINVLYGPTESTVFTTVNQYLPDNKMSMSGSVIGNPISNTQIYILSKSFEPLPIGVNGKIFISGIGVSKGYLNKPELTEEKFILNPFIEGERMYDTGDLGRWLPDGTVEFMGRKDNQVKIRGFRIELEEIEAVLLQYSKELLNVIVEAKDINGEKNLIAYFEANTIVDKSAIRSYLQERLPEYMIPSFYIELESIPLTANGKIDRKALPNVTGDDLIRKEYVAPSNDIEAKLVSIWEEVLGIEKVGITDDFFELGGQSIKVIKIIAQIKKVFNINIDMEKVFKYTTIKIFAQEIANQIWYKEDVSNDEIVDKIII
jgi:acyl-CoA synthetase (AMP-forming)/AMP-acid ligase II/acyl carrier protein